MVEWKTLLQFFFILVSNVASYMTSEKDSFYLWMQKSQMSILSMFVVVFILLSGSG